MRLAVASRRKPVLLLDVDGVLNVIGPNNKNSLVRLKDGHSFHPTRHVLPFMRWAWPLFEVVWCTAWRAGANAIADWAGLPRVRVADEPPSRIRRIKRLAKRKRKATPEEWLKVNGDWKVDAVKAMLDRRRCPVFWLEDGLSEQAHQWVAKRPQTHYVATDSFEGVTPAHVKILAELAGLPHPGGDDGRQPRS